MEASEGFYLYPVLLPHSVSCNTSLMSIISIILLYIIIYDSTNCLMKG